MTTAQLARVAPTIDRDRKRPREHRLRCIDAREGIRFGAISRRDRIAKMAACNQAGSYPIAMGAQSPSYPNSTGFSSRFDLGMPKSVVAAGQSRRRFSHGSHSEIRSIAYWATYFDSQKSRFAATKSSSQSSKCSWHTRSISSLCPALRSKFSSKHQVPSKSP
jgi:hypothetical protein